MSRRLDENIKVLNPKKVKPEWELIYENTNKKIDRLIEVYKDNPFHARILRHQGNVNEYQIKGFRNVDASNELKTKIQNILDIFNADIIPTYDFKEKTNTQNMVTENVFEVDLPF